MSMTYAELEQAMEDSLFAACRAAFVAAYPSKPMFTYADCDDGEWECPACPFKSSTCPDNKEKF